MDRKHHIRRMQNFLKLARDEAKRANTPKTLDKIRSAIKSAEGAERNDNAQKYRQAESFDDYRKRLNAEG